MVQVNRALIAALQDLIETCQDSEAGFHGAAQHVSSSLRRALLEIYSQQAARCAAELQAALRRLGGDPEAADLYAGLATPGWVTITGKEPAETEAASLAACECGVDAADESYATALAQRWPEEVRALLERQHAELKAIGRRIHEWAGHHRFGVRPPTRAAAGARSGNGQRPAPQPSAAEPRSGSGRWEPAAPAPPAPPG